MATTSIAQPRKCPSCGTPMHRRPDSETTPEQRFAGTWYDCDDPRCYCGSVDFSPEMRAFLNEQAVAHAKGEVERLETALAAKPRGRQRQRLEVWLQGARVALAIAEEDTDMATTIERLGTVVEQHFGSYNDVPDGNPGTMLHDREAAKSPLEREQSAIAYAFDETAARIEDYIGELYGAPWNEAQRAAMRGDLLTLRAALVERFAREWEG
jgi:hypothetical protein